MKKKPVLAFAGVIAILLVLRLYPMLPSQRSVLEGSEQFTLYSLQPLNDQDMEGIAPGNETFHRNKVLGKMLVTDPKVKAELVDALYQGIEENDGVAKCFNPRHGIHAVKNGRIIDVIICFECMQLDFIESGKKSHVLVAGTPQKLFDKVLTSGNVPLGQRRH